MEPSARSAGCSRGFVGSRSALCSSPGRADNRPERGLAGVSYPSAMEAVRSGK